MGQPLTKASLPVQADKPQGSGQGPLPGLLRPGHRRVYEREPGLKIIPYRIPTPRVLRETGAGAPDVVRTHPQLLTAAQERPGLTRDP